jgi:hypothetical protein
MRALYLKALNLIKKTTPKGTQSIFQIFSSSSKAFEKSHSIGTKTVQKLTKTQEIKQKSKIQSIYMKKTYSLKA